MVTSSNKPVSKPHLRDLWVGHDNKLSSKKVWFNIGSITLLLLLAGLSIWNGKFEDIPMGAVLFVLGLGGIKAAPEVVDAFRGFNGGVNDVSQAE